MGVLGDALSLAHIPDTESESRGGYFWTVFSCAHAHASQACCCSERWVSRERERAKQRDRFDSSVRRAPRGFPVAAALFGSLDLVQRCRWAVMDEPRRSQHWDACLAADPVSQIFGF